MAEISSINQWIPSHILQVILSKLSIFNLPICRIVCRAWNDLVLNYATTSKSFPITSIICTDEIEDSNSGRSFVHYLSKPKIHRLYFDSGMNLDPSFGFEDSCSSVAIFSSCNGLLFVTKYDTDGFCLGILNPMTNDFFNVTKEVENQYFCPAMVGEPYYYGFGFSPSTNYILVRVSFEMTKQRSSLEIYTFEGSNRWRHIHFLDFVVFQCNGVYTNGAIYWIGKHMERNKFVVCRLDVESLKIEETFLSEDGSSRAQSFNLLNSSLFASFRTVSYEIQVWMMQSFEGKELWSREFVIGIPENWIAGAFCFEIIRVCEDGEIWCVVYNHTLLLYNSKTNMARVQRSNQINPNRRIFLWYCEIESFNFSPLQKILTGKI